MKLLVFILLVVMVALATAKKLPQEPKLPDTDTCGRSQLCPQCCHKMRACLDQCFFWHTDRHMCRRNCTETSCNEGWRECKEKCDLPWCKGKEWDKIPLIEPF
ncbi:hypothetical protein BKA63DRAFT_572561 [Paraphoma chrysanthemicola]|nr:hypothetical protein BKA63DRAFT_572561 [Paraphoma chrysanthemicola]